MGSWGLGNLCKGPSAALHPSSEVTEFTSLIIGGNRKVIGIECCHRINASQLHINVSALLYCGCSGNTVASERHLSGLRKPGVPAPPPPQGRPCLYFLSCPRPRGLAHTAGGTWTEAGGALRAGRRPRSSNPLCRPGCLPSRGWRGLCPSSPWPRAGKDVALAGLCRQLQQPQLQVHGPRAAEAR